MLILPEFHRPFVLDSLSDPIVCKYNWIFNASITDYTLSPLTYLEETTGASLKLRVNGSEFWVPATWFVLVTDLDTLHLDCVSLLSCAANSFTAMAFNPAEMFLRVLDVRIIDFAKTMSLVHPMVQKGTAFVHPVGPAPRTSAGKEPNLSIAIGPHDLYKYLKGKVVGDVFS